MGVKLRAAFEAFQAFFCWQSTLAMGSPNLFPSPKNLHAMVHIQGICSWIFPSPTKSIFHSERLGMHCQSKGGRKKYSSVSTLVPWCWISKFASEQWLVPLVSMHMAYALHVLNAPVFVITLSACLSLYNIISYYSYPELLITRLYVLFSKDPFSTTKTTCAFLWQPHEG